MDLLKSLETQISTSLGELASSQEKLDPASWMQTKFFIPEPNWRTGEKGAIKLETYQEKCLREALSRDENGDFKYSIIIWSDIKKSAKSTIAAGVAAWKAEEEPWGEIYLIANDLKQATSRVAKYARRAILLNKPGFEGWRTRGNSIIAPNNSEIEAIPIDPSGEAGSNADMLQFSELWGAHEEAKEHMWAEMTLSPTKFAQSFRWVESYAGFSEESLLLWRLYETGVLNGEMLWPDEPYPVNAVDEFGEPEPIEAYVNKAARMFCLWNTKPRCPWQTQEYYDTERAVLTPRQFARMHRNQWVTSEEVFVPVEWWDACQDDDIPALDENIPMVITLDAATSDDTFGVLMGYRHPDKPNNVVVHYEKKWNPPIHGKLDFIGTEENPGPEREVRRLIDNYNVVQVAYDNYQLHDMATRLSREGLAWMFAFSQGSDRLVADSQLRDKIRDRTIHHGGAPDLREHIQNANAKTDEKEDRKIRIVKRVAHLKIDLAVCLSMMVHEVMRLNL